MGISTALEGVFDRATTFAIVVLGGLVLGGDRLSDCVIFRLAMVGCFGGVVVIVVDLVGEMACFFVDGSSFLLLVAEDSLDDAAGTEVGGIGCLRE